MKEQESYKLDEAQDQEHEADPLSDLLGWGDPMPAPAMESPKRSTGTRRSTACLVRSDKHVWRRAAGATVLLEAAGVPFEDGHSYHYITSGDVDALSFLQAVLVHQPLDHCLFSTWCMAAEDVLAFGEWLESGKIKKLDAYVGEIFPGSYAVEWTMLKQLFHRHQCGRIIVARNHSKVFAGTGPRFAFGIQTSANINTNPRIENGCITIGADSYLFYRNFFGGMCGVDHGSEER